jgi:hypothetical protein
MDQRDPRRGVGLPDFQEEVNNYTCANESSVGQAFRLAYICRAKPCPTTIIYSLPLG